jgi:hypothetical protein
LAEDRLASASEQLGAMFTPSGENVTIAPKHAHATKGAMFTPSGENVTIAPKHAHATKLAKGKSGVSMLRFGISEPASKSREAWHPGSDLSPDPANEA